MQCVLSARSASRSDTPQVPPPQYRSPKNPSLDIEDRSPFTAAAYPRSAPATPHSRSQPASQTFMPSEDDPDKLPWPDPPPPVMYQEADTLLPPPPPVTYLPLSASVRVEDRPHPPRRQQNAQPDFVYGTSHSI